MKHLSCFLLAAAAVIASAASAQTTSTQTSTTSQLVTSSVGLPAGILIPPKPHAPFSAVLVSQLEERLSDGTNITRENEEVVMRDGAGRVYRGREIKIPGHADREPRMSITITDPVQHAQYFCTSTVKVCRKSEYREPPNRGRIVGRGTNFVTVEDLGSSNVGGIEVKGERITRVIPEGTVGNDRAFTATEELWHSNELDTDVQTRRSDPRMGTRTTTLTEVHLGEPDAKYFQIPEGYRVEEHASPLVAPGVMSTSPADSETSSPAEPVPPKQ